MALVSSISPSTSLYPGSPPIHARTTSESPSISVPATLVRKVPSPGPPTLSSSPTLTRTMHASPSKLQGQQQRGEGSGGSSSNSQLAYMSYPSRQGLPASSSSSGYTTGLSASGAVVPGKGSGGSSPSSSANSVRLPSPLPPPSRSASTPPSPARPTATPLPYQANSHHHQHSSSSSSLPRSLPHQHQAQQLHSQQGTPAINLMAHPQLAHPSFVGQPFSPFAPPHAFAHPAFPFVPSPHPSQNAANSNYVSYSPSGQLTPGGSAEQQKRMQAFQQAQWTAAATQMESLRNQQQTTYGQDARKRTTSGPASSHQSSPTYYTTPLPYPPSPSPTLHQTSGHYSQNASFPVGGMLPHGYPTPPGSVEGVVRGGESGGSSSGGSREGGYHPYRRDHQHHQAAKSSSSDSGTRSSSTPRSAHSTTPSTSSTSSQRVTVPKGATHGQTESSQLQTLPRSHAPSPSLTSTRSSTLPNSFSQPQLSAGPYAARPRTHSSNSSSSSLHRPQYEPLPTSSSPIRPRTSFDTNRSATPQAQQNRPRPSPLGGVHQPLPVDSEDDESDDGADSDGTAEATATVNKATSGTGVNRSPTMNSMATITSATPIPTIGKGDGKGKDKEKEKEKKGMASRFKKAFGGSSGNSGNNHSNSSSSATLAEVDVDVDGRGPKGAAMPFRKARSDSVSSSETSPNQRNHPSSHHAPQPSIASMTSSSTRTVNGDADSTRRAPSSRFRLLNSKLNSSTDNISISSTVSSASVMIRKLGQMGKLARRNSLMGLTKAFKKDKNKDASRPPGDEDEDPIKTSKKDKKGKSGASLASVSHATAEVESSPNRTATGMSPAAALAKRQQMHYAEQEAAAEAAKAQALAAEEAAKLGPPRGQHGRTDSDAASVKSGKSGRWGIGRSKTTDDVAGERSQALEKEKEKLKSRSKFGRLGFGGSKTDLRSTDAASIIDDASSIAGTERGGSALGLYHDADSTPRQSLEILAPPQAYATYGEEVIRRDSSSDYEPSLYRHGAAPVKSNNRAVKGILKGAGTYSQEQYAKPRPSFHRIRASSFDAPQPQGRSGSPGGAALVNVIPTQAQVDGVAPSTTSPRADTHSPTSTEQMHDSALSRIETGGSMYGNPSMNASAPVLTHFSAQTTIRSNSAPGAAGRRIAFAANLSVHTTWPAAIYDRRAEPATCNRLTPTLAQQIKEELNSFKMEEMDVHPDSRKLTHFFV